MCILFKLNISLNKEVLNMKTHAILNNTVSTETQIDNKDKNSSTKINSCSVRVVEPNQQPILSSSDIYTKNFKVLY